MNSAKSFACYLIGPSAMVWALRRRTGSDVWLPNEKRSVEEDPAVDTVWSSTVGQVLILSIAYAFW